SGQLQPDVTANEAFAKLDQALCETTQVEVTDGVNSVSAAVWQSALRLELVDDSSSPTAAFDVEVPALRGVKLIANATSYPATVSGDEVASWPLPPVLPAGTEAWIYCDGSTVHAVAAAPIERNYDVGMFVAGLPGSSEIVM